MNAGRASDRDISGGSTGDPLIDNNSFQKEGRATFSKTMLPFNYVVGA
jgi:hypothetical protein